MTRPLPHSFVRFLGVGVINTIVGASVMFLCYNLFGMSYWISSATNYIVGSIVSFYLNRRFTFAYTRRDGATVVRFAIGIVACYAIAYGVAKPLALTLLDGQPQAWQENTAMGVGAALFVVVNYGTQRWFVFRNTTKTKENR